MVGNKNTLPTLQENEQWMVGNKNTLPTLQENEQVDGGQQKHVTHPTRK